MTIDTSLKSSYALLLESAKKCKFAKLNDLHFSNAIDNAISNMQKYLQTFNLMCN